MGTSFEGHQGLKPEQPPQFRIADVEQWAKLLHSHSRPLLVHLNADTTWLLQLPRPDFSSAPKGRTHFNILFDPWLQGPQSDVAWWFSTQWHVVAPSVATVADLNNVLQRTEGNGLPGQNITSGAYIDVIAISHEFTDHCHEATLRELPPDTPVFAGDVAADLIRTWAHFKKVVNMPHLGRGVHWSKLSVGGLPDWVAIGRVTTPGNALYYHAAVLVTFDLGCEAHTERRDGEAVLYSPHGIQSQDLESLHASGIKTLALMHGMHDVRIWAAKQLNLGALNGIKAAEVSNARYWVATHDEVKLGGGLIAPFLLRKQYTFTDALTHGQTQRQMKEEVSTCYHFQELGSGDGLVLA